MKKYKYYFLAIAIVGFATIAVFNVNLVLNSQSKISDVSLENVEALASEDTNPCPGGSCTSLGCSACCGPSSKPSCHIGSCGCNYL